MRRIELLGLIAILAVAYGATSLTWLLGAQLNVALGVGCIVFAVVLGLAEAGLALWAIVRRREGCGAKNRLRFDDDARRALEAQRARALRIMAIQRAARSDRLPPAA